MSERTRRTRIWGDHLVIDRTDPHRPYVDPEGNRFTTLREAFWKGQLGMSDYNPAIVEPQIEFLHAYLASRIHWENEGREDMDGTTFDQFEGRHSWRWFYGYWAEAQGWVGNAARNPLEGPLTEEGAAVLLMLDATRSQDMLHKPLGRSSVQALVSAVFRNDTGEDRRRRFERESSGWPNRIERRTIGTIATLVLVGRPAQARIPALRILWSVDLPNEQARDALFDWCIDRAARWDDWAALAYRKGGAALTRLMLAMVAAERASAAGTDGERGRDNDRQIRPAAIEHLK